MQYSTPESVGISYQKILEYVKQLEKNHLNTHSLIISKANSADLVCIGQLTKLKVLSINGFNISQETLKTIGSLTLLEKLTLTNAGLSTIAPLSDLVNLTYLDLSSNSLGRIDVMANFTKLTELYISGKLVNIVCK